MNAYTFSRNKSFCDGDTLRSAINAIEVLEQTTNGQLTGQADNVWTGMDSERWSLATCNSSAEIEDLIVWVRKDLEHEIFPTKVRKRIETMTDFVQKFYKDWLAGPLSSEEELVSVDVAALVQAVIDWRKKCQLAAPGHVQGIHFRVDHARSDYPLLVRANPQWLRRTVDILVDNGSQAMVDSLIKKLTISTELRDNRVNIRVSDTGKGISAEEQPLLFKEPIKKSPGNRGRELLVARCIVEAYGGKLQVESTGVKGTTMSVWLPLEWLREECQGTN
jgi:signal transduction histidine kinase